MSNAEQREDGLFEIRFSGRLDAQGAKTLQQDLDDCLRQGQHHLLLDLEDTEFISSAGIRVLLIFHKKLKAIDGHFCVNVSDRGNVREILELSGLNALIAANHEGSHTPPPTRESFTSEGAEFEVMKQSDGGLDLRVIGAAEKLVSGSFSADEGEMMTFPRDRLAIGIGALGRGFEDCRQQFGEFMAIGGAALTRPPGSSEIDYILARDKVVPQGCLLCGIALQGEFDTIFRFSPTEGDEPLPLSRLCRTGLELAATDCVVLAAAVEVADIVGAALIKSPAEKSAEENIFSFPSIRDWLSFTGEPVHRRTTALVLGIVAAERDRLSGRMLSPIGDSLFGMFKAGIFSYEPLSRDQGDLAVISQGMFDRHQPVDLLHLINDQRELLGVGQSRFFRGTVWTGAINEVKA